MKKISGLLILFIMALLVTPLFAVTSLDGLVDEVNFSDLCMETKTTMTTVENQAVSAPVFGGVAVLSVGLSEQVVIGNNTVLADIGLEMETLIVGSSLNTNISGLRGDYLHYAGIG